MSPPPPTEQLASPPPPTEQLASPPPPTPSPATTTNTGKEYKILQAQYEPLSNPEGKLQELTSDGWELINGMVDKSLTHNMYLSRQNATTYEYMYDGQDDGDVEQRLNELGGEGWILISAEFTSQA